MSWSQALVLAGHGSQRHPRSAAPLHAHADRIRESGRFDEVRTAFWKEEPSLRDVTATIASDVAYVVPVLTSEGYFADVVFPREFGLGKGDPEVASVPTDVDVRYAEPVGTHRAMTDVVLDRIEAAIDGSPSDVAVALVGHGTERHERSARSTVDHARRIRERGRYAEVCALFLDEDPHVGDLYDRLEADEIVVVPLFVADGHHTTTDVPEAIGHPGIGETATVEGRRVHYAGAVGTEPSLAEVIVERATEAGATVDPEPVGGGRTASADGFLRRLDASPAGTEWGELRIANGSGGYELRHRDDADAPRGALEPLGRPREVRDRVRADDRGRYRPLSGARTLPTGWVLPDLGPDGLVRAVRFVYPGSITHWWDERNEEFDATHFRDTVARQTGVYADLEGFDGAALEAAAEAVCGTCVRRRRWEAGADEPTDAHAGDGTIPCREACPFFLSAAHAFDDANGPDPAEPMDQEVPPGAFEEPGNRYRVRFARALARRRSGKRGSEGLAGADGTVEERSGEAVEERSREGWPDEEPIAPPSGGER